MRERAAFSAFTLLLAALVCGIAGETSAVEHDRPPVAPAGSSVPFPETPAGDEGKTVSSDRFALSVCQLGTTKKITAGGKVVYMCEPAGERQSGLRGKPERSRRRPGISSSCREGADGEPEECSWKCRAYEKADCSLFLTLCVEFGGFPEGDGEEAACFQTPPEERTE